MKKKIIVSILVIMMLANVNIYNVKADNEESVNNTTNEYIESEEDLQNENSQDEVAAMSEEDNDSEKTTRASSNETTRFENAKISLKKDGNNKAIVEITGATPKEGSLYYLKITSNGSKPDVGSGNDDMMLLSFDDNKNTFLSDAEQTTGYVEKTGELYASIIEEDMMSIRTVIKYGVKLDRFDEPKYSDAFYETFVDSHGTQIVTSFTHSSEVERKVTIKIGKITDTKILQKIKNQNSSGFADLISFAKNDNGLYNESLKNEYPGNSCIGYDSNGDDSKIINVRDIADGAYYYLYLVSDSEDGKYISNEAVTLAQASVYGDIGTWYLFFYGNSDFRWADYGDINEDNQGEENNDDKTTSPSNKLPQTGAYGCVAFVVGAIAVVGAISYRNYKKNNF